MRFGTWLAAEMERQGLSRREVARRLAVRHPKGVTTQTVETYRRAVRRYLEVDDPQKPTEQTRNAIADALGIDRTSLPADDDEDEDLAATLQALLREQKDLSRRMERALKGVQA